MHREIGVEGLPLRDRLLLAVVNWATGRLDEPGRIRLRWHLVRERGLGG